MNCITKKRCYDTREQAEEALVHSYVRFNHQGGQGPVNVYQCTDCHTYHLTSKGERHPILKTGSNRIKLQREASFWEDKMRKK